MNNTIASVSKEEISRDVEYQLKDLFLGFASLEGIVYNSHSPAMEDHLKETKDMLTTMIYDWVNQFGGTAAHE